METIQKHLTDRFLFSHRNPPGVSQINFKHTRDDLGVTLYCRCNGRSKTWYFRKEVPDKTRTVWTVGHFPKLKVAEAEEAARELATDLANGVEVVADEPKLRINTVDEALNVYLAAKRHVLAERTVKDYRCDIAALGWGGLQIRKISSSMVNAKVDEYVKSGKIASGNAALETLQRLYLYFGKKGLLRTNPVAHLTQDKLWPEHAPSRPIFKKPEDWATAMLIAREWSTPEIGDFWMFAAFTGLRPWQEIATLKWSEVDFDTRTFTILNQHLKVKGPGRVKKGRTLNLVLPITEPLRAILNRRYSYARPSYSKRQREFVFPSKLSTSATGHIMMSSTDALVRAIRDVLAYPEGEEIVTYSLRRFFITAQRKANIVPEVRFYLTDQDPTRLRGVQAVYDPLDFEDDIRPEADRLADWLSTQL